LALIAVDLMSTNVTFAALGKTGKILQRENIKLIDTGGKDLSILIQKQIKRLLSTFEHRPLQIKSVGIAVPGIYYSKTGNVWAPNIKEWENYPLKQDMSQLMEQNIRVKIAGKRTCDILGEKWLGAAKKSRNAIYLSIGSGIGAGVLIDGKILHGFNDGVAAVGWLAMDKHFKDVYKSRGFFEFKASGNGILLSVREELEKNKKYRSLLRRKEAGELTIPDVFAAYDKKDKIAIKVIKESIKYWGITSANLISLFNPEIIIFGGSLFGPAFRFIDEIKTEAEQWAQPIFMKDVRFTKSLLGADAGLFGAGHLAMKKF
jgi:glucokinase